MKITNINQLLPFVDQKPEFIVMDKGDYTVIDYVYQDANTFDLPELMECRGIKFDKEGLIIARPLRKFFNYGERGSNLPIHRSHIITTKLDGSMVHPAILGPRVYLMTRKGHTDVAKQAESYVINATHSIRYMTFCRDMLVDGWTPIFEYTGPNNRIVLRYEEEALTLLAMRHTVEGTTMNRLDMERVAEGYDVPCVTPPSYMDDNPRITNIDEFVKHTRELEDAEGYVIYFDDGYIVKIKADDYVTKHRALDNLGSKKKVVALCCQGGVDDILPLLSDEDRDELAAFNSDFQQEVTSLAQDCKDLTYYVITSMITRKEFALTVAPSVKPRWLAGVCFSTMDGKDARMSVLKNMEKHYKDVETEWRGQ